MAIQILLNDVAEMKKGSKVFHLFKILSTCSGNELKQFSTCRFLKVEGSPLSCKKLYVTCCPVSFRIQEGKTPEDRMLAVLEFYLTSFHVGRKVSVAKLIAFHRQTINSRNAHTL